MAVRPDARLPGNFEEIEPVPERRHGIAHLRIGIVLVEGGAQRRDRPGGSEVLHLPRPTDPAFELFRRHAPESPPPACDSATLDAGWKDGPTVAITRPT